KPADRRPGKGERGTVPSGTLRLNPAAPGFTGALPGPTNPRRGSPVRGHLPSPAALKNRFPIPAGRDSRDRPEAAKVTLEGIWLAARNQGSLGRATDRSRR